MIFQFSTPCHSLLTCMLMSAHSAQPLKCRLRACVRAGARARAGPGQRREAPLWSHAQQLQSRLMLSQPHVVFSPSFPTAPEASKYLLYCTRTARWVGGGPAPFANHLVTVLFRCAPNMTLIDKISETRRRLSSASRSFSVCVSFNLILWYFCIFVLLRYFQDHSRGRVFRG